MFSLLHFHIDHCYLYNVSGTVNGEWCDEVVIVGYGCFPGSPHWDREGSVCANDHEWNEAYCSYSLGSAEIDSETAWACAYCAASTGFVYMVFY